MAVPHLDPSQLYEKRKTADMYRLKTYNKILDQIYHRILTVSRTPNSPCQILYQIPPFILGLPKLDLEDCSVYLIHQLRHAKYAVSFTYPNLLFISWMHHEKSYVLEQSPITKTMLESFQKTQEEQEASRLLYGKKSQKKVRVQDPTATSYLPPIGPSRSSFKQDVPLQAINTVLSKPAVSKAAEYTPPSNFLQSLMNPPSTAAKPATPIDYLR